MRFALFQLGEYGEMFAMAAMAVTLFLGGGAVPSYRPRYGSCSSSTR
jgi:NADH:ubiquinone oxidoreductase subunit H